MSKRRLGGNSKATCKDSSSSSMSFTDLPTEMCFEVFSYLDLASIRQARLGSKHWKLMVDTSHDLRFTCQLTDETLSVAVNSTELFSCVQIRNFSGKDNKVVSATRGTGRLMAYADTIHLIGKNINPTELGKMMKYATRSVKELEFRVCPKSVLLSVFEVKRSFTDLRKLVIGYKTFPRRAHTIALERLASPHYALELPSLEHFKISYELDSVQEMYTQRFIPTACEVFSNYLTIAKVIVKFRRTLKVVEIARNEVIRTALVLQVDTSQIALSQFHRRIIQECLSNFDQVNLEKLHIAPMLDEGEYPWILETSLLKRQRNLKEVSLNKKLCSPRLGSQALETVLPRNFEAFTSVKVALTCMGNVPVDLGAFSQCPNLKTLWLAFYRGVRIGPARENSLHFINLEMLPKTIQSLHFKTSQQDTIIIHQQSILSRAQLRWVIHNMLELKSLWLQLVVEQSAVDPVADANEVADNQAAPPEARQVVNRLQELNANANVNVDTFRELISMPKLKEMKFDMLKASQLAAILELGADGNPWILPQGIHVSLEDIREYTAICEDAHDITYNTQVTSLFPFGFIELTVTRQ